MGSHSADCRYCDADQRVVGTSCCEAARAIKVAFADEQAARAAQFTRHGIAFHTRADGKVIPSARGVGAFLTRLESLPFASVK